MIRWLIFGFDPSNTMLVWDNEGFSTNQLNGSTVVHANPFEADPLSLKRVGLRLFPFKHKPSDWQGTCTDLSLEDFLYICITKESQHKSAPLGFAPPFFRGARFRAEPPGPRSPMASKPASGLHCSRPRTKHRGRFATVSEGFLGQN